MAKQGQVAAGGISVGIECKMSVYSTIKSLEGLTETAWAGEQDVALRCLREQVLTNEVPEPSLGAQSMVGGRL